MEIEDKDLEMISQGAEAKVYIVKYFGEKAILKQRLFKTYRHPTLDERLSNERIQNEVRNMARARKAGINTPYVMNVDIVNRRIYMQYVESTKLRDFLFQLKDKKQDNQYNGIKYLLSDIAKGLAMMHDQDIIHGDLTTSNILLKHSLTEGLQKGDQFYQALYFIDFGLSFVKNHSNEKGIDLYVLEKAFLSTHPERQEEETIGKLNVARTRGRKKVAFG